MDTIPLEHRDALADYFALVNVTLDVLRKRGIHIVAAIASAHKIVTAGITSQFSFEALWTEYDAHITTCENADDDETLWTRRT
jgi:hypothetical protein